MPHLSHPRYRADIDGLRALAVLSVVGFHAFPSWIPGGFIGVDIFFVISGYLISTIILGNLEGATFSYVEFYSRRIRRIFPALIVVLASTVAIGWCVLLPWESKQLGKHVAAGASFVSNFALWFDAGYFDPAAETKPLLHFWSLGIEEQFYIVWPLLLGMVWKRKWNFLTVTLSIAIASFAINLLTVSRNPVAAFYSPASRAWELMIGGILAYLALHKPERLPQTRWSSPLGLALIVLGLLLMDRESRVPGWWVLLPTIGAFLMISAGTGAWLNRHVLSSRVMVWFGLISYPLYLWHWVLLSYLRILEGQTPTGATRMAAILASVALAWITYRFVETPIRHGKGASRRRLTVALCVAMTSVGLAGHVSYALDGRMLRRTDRSLAEEYDWKSGYRFGQCFLASGDSPPSSSGFADLCAGLSKGLAPSPLVLIWGDSHVASLYRGLDKQTKSFGFDLAQYTSMGCPPIVDFPGCKNRSQHALRKIEELHPDTVILGANWSRYDGTGDWPALDFDKLKATIQALRALGVAHLVLFGQLPVFHSAQPGIAVKEFVRDKKDRTYRNFDADSGRADEQIRAFAKDNHVGFVSPIDLLCNAEGCLISTSRNKLVPLAWDVAHLTEAGSMRLIDLAIRERMLHLPHRE